MWGFAQIGRRSHCEFEQGTRLVELVGGHGFATEGQVSADMLPEWAAFAAFPWLKLAAGYQFTSFVMLAGLVVERTEFDAEIIPLVDEVETFRQFAQAFIWFFTHTLPKLVALVEKAGVGGIH